MKQIFFTTAIITLLLTSCTVDFVPHERIRPSSFMATYTNYLSNDINRISVSGIIDLHLSLGEENRMEIRANDNVLPHIGVSMLSENGLEIYLRGVSFSGPIPPQIMVYLTLKDLRELRLSGRQNTAHLHLLPEQTLISDRLDIRASGSTSIYFQTDGWLEANTLAITLSGTSSFRGDNISANRINANLSGSSTLDLAGESIRFYLTSSGASRTHAFDLTCDHLNANLSGTSGAQVAVQETLRATLSGTSILIYDGNPDILHSQISGRSSLRQR